MMNTTGFLGEGSLSKGAQQVKCRESNLSRCVAHEDSRQRVQPLTYLGIRCAAIRDRKYALPAGWIAIF
jgi:hypothetical protein